VVERAGDADWYKVALRGGQNYAFVAATATEEGCVTISVRDARGRRVAGTTAFANGGSDVGFEYRPSRSATFFVAFAPCAAADTFPFGYRGNVTADARADATTAATIRVGQTIDGNANYGIDQDYFRTTLQGGRRYTLEVEDSEFVVQLVDRRGRVFCQEFGAAPPCAGFTVAESGTYFVVVKGADDFGRRYSVSLTLSSP
jgi:hypothetical protein